VLGLVNFSDGGVAETFRRFQMASAGSHHPARSPTRGSGLGAAIDMLEPDADAPLGGEGVVAHAAVNDNPAASDTDDTRAAVHRVPRR
jgi:hypothetical protein